MSDHELNSANEGQSRLTVGLGMLPVDENEKCIYCGLNSDKFHSCQGVINNLIFMASDAMQRIAAAQFDLLCIEKKLSQLGYSMPNEPSSPAAEGSPSGARG